MAYDVDYFKFKQAVALITVALCAVVFVSDYSNTAFDTRYVEIDLTGAIFFILFLLRQRQIRNSHLYLVNNRMNLKSWSRKMS